MTNWDGVPNTPQSSGWHLVQRTVAPIYDEVWFWNPSSDLSWQRCEAGSKQGYEPKHFVCSWAYIGPLQVVKSNQVIHDINTVKLPTSRREAQAMSMAAERWLSDNPVRD